MSAPDPMSPERLDNEDEDEVCGDTYAHDLRNSDERDGILIEVCRNCGAELITDLATGDAL